MDLLRWICPGGSAPGDLLRGICSGGSAPGDLRRGICAAGGSAPRAAGGSAPGSRSSGFDKAFVTQCTADWADSIVRGPGSAAVISMGEFI